MDICTDRRHAAIVYESGATCPLCDALDSINDLTRQLYDAKDEINDLRAHVEELYSRLNSAGGPV